MANRNRNYILQLDAGRVQLFHESSRDVPQVSIDVMFPDEIVAFIQNHANRVVCGESVDSPAEHGCEGFDAFALVAQALGAPPQPDPIDPMAKSVRKILDACESLSEREMDTVRDYLYEMSNAVSAGRDPREARARKQLSDREFEAYRAKRRGL